MDSSVIEFDIGLGGDDNIDIGPSNGDEEIPIDSPDDGGSFSDAAFPLQTYIPEGEFDLEPYEGMEFESEEAAKAFYNSYARRIGFSTRVSSSRRSRKDGAIIQRSFVCAKEGFRNMNEKRTKNREVKRPRMVTRVGCKASLSLKIQDSGKWLVFGFVKDHNHDLVAPDQVHSLRSHRQISGPAKNLIDTLQAAGMGPRRIMSVLIKEYGDISKVGFTEVDCRNYIRNNRQKSMEGDIQLLLDHLKQKQVENPAFYYAVQGDEEHYAGNVFWADTKARSDYNHFGDTVTFDSTYRSNKYRLPFVPFTGLNHHGQPVLFGCAFLINESEASFVWLFKTWLEAFSGRPPVSITTEYDSVIRSAITQVFPHTRHRFCKWHMFKKCQERLSHMLVKHHHFESDLHKCVNLCESTEEFKSCWHSFIDKYDLRDHDWLQSIYAERRQWVPAYLRDTFFAEMCITQRSENMNSYFDGYINASTNLNQFVKLYENALESRHEKEIKADFDTMNSAPSLKTPSPMEKQASDLYTRKLFMRFQEELVNTLTFMASKMDDDDDDDDNGEMTTYQVSKFGEDHKSYRVRFDVLKMMVSCSCQMFEFSGLLCRHALAVFRVTNVLKLPSHYILKRWTKNARSSVTLEERVTNPFNNYLESHTVRQITLRQEALKFVDKGAKSADTYKVAMIALAEASNKLALATKNVGKVSITNGHMRDILPNDGIQPYHGSGAGQDNNFDLKVSEDDMDQRINELSMELECANGKCEVYRSNLLALLNDIEDHKQRLSMEVQNIKLGMKSSI